MGVVQVDDFLPSVVSHRVDDGTMVIRAHAYGKVQETGGWREDLETRKIIPIPFSFSFRKSERENRFLVDSSRTNGRVKRTKKKTKKETSRRISITMRLAFKRHRRSLLVSTYLSMYPR